MAQTSSERACDRCRERRVKCDKRHPSCFRCEKLGKPCPGYDKKRKFVDEGENLRKRFQLRTEDNGQLREELSNHASPRVSLPPTDAQTRPAKVKTIRPALPSVRPLNPILSNHSRTSSVRNVAISPAPVTSRGLNESDSTIAAFRPIGHVAAVPDPTITTVSQVTDDHVNQNLVLDNYDPEWFDIDPTEAYAQGMNSCGFIPSLPNIVDEVDRTGFVGAEVVETPVSVVSLADATWITETQIRTSAVIKDEREHEMAFLIRHFTECIGPWMDLFNQDRHFEQLVPLKALRDALLRNAIAAVSAKQLGRVQGVKSCSHASRNQEPARMEALEEAVQTDWFYKAANYYDKAIAFSRLYLQAISSGLSEVQTPKSQGPVNAISSDDLLVAVSIFSLYEALDNTDTGWSQHLAGLNSLLQAIHSEQAPIPPSSSATAGQDAAFWNFARADYQSAYLNNRKTLLDTRDIGLWRRYGLQIQLGGVLYFDPAAIKAETAHIQSTTQLVSHTLLWLVLCVVNFIAENPAKDEFVRSELWQTLSSQLDDWHSHLPSTFEPCAQMKRPMCAGPKQSDRPQIREVFFSIQQCAAAMHLYHFARILLLLNKPSGGMRVGRLQAYRQVISEAGWHAQEIIGIALGRPPPAVRIEMSLPLYMSGTCLENDDERRVVLQLLKAIEKDTGCSTQARVQNLLTEWAWDVEAAG